MSDDFDDDDDEEQAFEARYNARRQRMLTQPPRCVAPFNVTLATTDELRGIAFDGHGEPTQSIFRVRCTCGGDSFRVRGTFHAKDYKGDPLNFFGDPIELICTSCEKEHVLFESREHGYNAEIADDLLPMPGRRSKEPDAPRIDYSCTTCGDQSMHIWTRFEHTAETCEDSFAESLSEGREQDFFSWFTLVARCAKCSAVRTVTEFECA